MRCGHRLIEECRERSEERGGVRRGEVLIGSGSTVGNANSIM